MSKNKDVFLRAAKWCDIGYNHSYGACVAIAQEDGVRRNEETIPYYLSDQVQKFTLMFKPSHTTNAFWLSNKQNRVIALLLAHAMRQTGDI